MVWVRATDIETLTTLHLRATSQETFASRLPRSFSFSHCGNEALPFLNLDFRYDILSQISRYIENYPCDVSNLPIAITECPTVWCGKMVRNLSLRSRLSAFCDHSYVACVVTVTCYCYSICAWYSSADTKYFTSSL